MRKLDQKEQEQDYSESARRADSMDLNELNDKLEILKNHAISRSYLWGTGVKTAWILFNNLFFKKLTP